MLREVMHDSAIRYDSNELDSFGFCHIGKLLSFDSNFRLVQSRTEGVRLSLQMLDNEIFSTNHCSYRTNVTMSMTNQLTDCE